MDAELFLATQAHWLVPSSTSHPEDNKAAVPAPSAKRLRRTRLSLHASWHVGFTEQYGPPPSSWAGPRASDAVFVRLAHGGAHCSNSTTTSSMAAAALSLVHDQKHGEMVLLHFGNREFTVCAKALRKVVCSPDVMTSARSQLKEHGDCAGGLLAAVASDKCSSTTFACLVTSHVCLSLFVQHPQQQQQKSCQPAQPMVAHEAADMLGSAAACLQRHAWQCSGSDGKSQPPQGGEQITRWLMAAECESQLLQLLLASTQADTYQIQHLLLSLGHVHAGTTDWGKLSDLQGE